MAFPTTGILDDFDRANENPLSQGGNWTGIAELDPMEVVSNMAVAVSNFGASYRGSYADAEVYVTIVTTGGSIEHNISTRWQDVGGASPIRDSRRRGYTLIATPAQYRLRRTDDGSSGSNIIAATNWPGGSINDGDKVGLSSIGAVHTIYLQRTAGAWTQIDTFSDGTYTNAGALTLQCSDTSAQHDDFGGGAVATGGSLAWVRA